MLKKILFASALVIAATQAHADSFNVFVGYTDNLRPSGFYPNPYCVGNNGSTCQVETNVQLDGGTFRVDDTGGTSLNITNIEVTLNGGADVFKLWNDVTITPGQRAIFGQTTQYDFDTSDYNFFTNIGMSINGIGGCTYYGDLTPSQQATCTANDPVISFDVNGIAYSFVDSGSILNTGGYDLNCCAPDGNESIGWHQVGQGVTTRNNVPEPMTLSLFGVSLAGAVAAIRRRRKVSKSV